MRYKLMVSLLCALFVLAACEKTGPAAALEDMARALNRNNSAAFLARIDMSAFAANYISSMTRNDEALNSLNSIGELLGLGSLDRLIGSVVDMGSRLTREFDRGVASGELMAQCKASTRPDCPWTPQALSEAQVYQLNDVAAVAKVTTQARITSWLALRKNGGAWQVVGQAVMENRARELALTGGAEAAPGGQQASPAPTPI